MSQGAGEVIIVVDDGSPLSVVETAFDGVPNLRVLKSEGSVGAGRARNLGADVASQPWLTFLDVDDWWPDRFLRDLYAGATQRVVGYDSTLWAETDDVGPVATGETAFSRAGWTHPSVDRSSSELLLDGFPLLKVLLDRSVFRAVGGYRQIYAVEDFDLLWRLIAAGERVQLVRDPAGHYLVHRGSTTDQVHTERLAYERAQRSWLRIWTDMARTRGLPVYVRRRCLVRSLSTTARLASLYCRGYRQSGG